jgi:bacterioferritin-associated ferredoxin
MYVCVCNGVTDRDIRKAVDDGASSLGDLREQLNVASCCGRCASCAGDVLREARAEKWQTADIMLSPALA